VIVALPLVLPAGAFQTAAPLRTNLAALSASPVSLSKLALPLHAKPQRRRAVLGALRAEADAGSADLVAPLPRSRRRLQAYPISRSACY